jgi:hypothetical protein
MGHSKVLRALLGIGLLAGFGAVLAVPAGATGPYSTDPATPAVICTGTNAVPGQLTGTYDSNVVVNGVCLVNEGTATIIGDLTLDPGATVNATFALDDFADYTGTSSLDVIGNINVGEGATLVLGCEPNYFPCSDDSVVDEGATGPGTLSSQDHVWGNIDGDQPLAVIIHNSVILGNVNELGGGGGVNCTAPTTGVFSLPVLQSPVYSDYEDNYIGGDLDIAGLQTCFLAIARNNIQGGLSNIGNVFADPNANEVKSNQIHKGIDCSDNSPSVQFGKGGGVSNQVVGYAQGECSFDTLLPDPAPAGPLTPISVQG